MQPLQIVGSHRRHAKLAWGALAAAVVVAAGAGCAGRESVTESAPEPTTAQPSATAAVTPASSSECFAVADTYLAVTLLPLDTTDGDSDSAADDDATISLSRTADSVDDSVDSLPQDVHEPLHQAAQILRDAGDRLNPQELMEVRDTLQPVHTWLNQRCSTVDFGASAESGQDQAFVLARS
ncbi:MULTISPECIES: hypothetical protein [Kocuria]|uniref:Uncharacterized protein n=1 Tax=Kocuria subflava TaxID=1736139 RepID=A0A846U510_9MICC|nr:MULTISPECIES: hypothetical protein [Kocuria]NKE09841.1 hypothetical protein [Kocuria subflava]